MVPISIDEFAKNYVQINKGEKLEDLKERLKNAVKRKKEGQDAKFAVRKFGLLEVQLLLKVASHV